MRPFSSDLADNHAPEAVFLACADARVVPHLLTMSGPGDLFVIRNIGNLIPRADSADSSVSGALEYAVEVLGVPDLLICGHSGCGAMKALSDGLPDGVDALQQWLQAAEPTARRWKDDPLFADSDHGEIDRLSMTNAVQQLDNAMTLPFLRSAVESGRLRISAAFFDVASATLSLYDPRTGTFSAG